MIWISSLYPDAVNDRTIEVFIQRKSRGSSFDFGILFRRSQIHVPGVLYFRIKTQK